MKRLVLLISIAAFVGALHTALYLSPWGHSLEMKFLDLWFHLRGLVPSPGNVVVVAMDEDSYGTLGLSPTQAWPRIKHAELLKRLSEAGAKRVVFDVLFLGESLDPEVDQKLAMAFHLIPTVLGADYGVIEEGSYHKEGLVLPLKDFRKHTQTALVGLPEEEGYIRRFWVKRSELTSNFSTLAEVAVGDKISHLPDENDLINYYGPPRTLPTYSYYQALEQEHPLPPETFRDKIVFVGLSLRTELGPAQKDAYLTPFSKEGRMFGVEIHATAAENLIRQDWISQSPFNLEALFLAVWTFMLSLLLFRFKPQRGIWILLGAETLWVLAAYMSFLKEVFLPGAVLNVMILPFNFLVSTLYYYVITRRKKRQLQRAFEFYLSPEMAREVAHHPQALRLGGEKVVATALFTDIEGFTEKAEGMTPENVATLLNAYFTEVMDAIFEKKGTLIKFIGDAVFALWGAPIKTDQHAQWACETALAIQEEIKKFNASGRFPPLKTRIGIHTGPMVVGNLGSKRRFDFTAIGDCVNLASRVEGLNKYFGTQILITDAVLTQSKSIAHLELGSVQVVGKKECVPLYTLLHEPLPKSIETSWMSALQKFKNQDWDEASKLFEKLYLKNTLLKKSCELYLEQIKFHRVHPPAQEWKGEIVFTAK
ncbi:MAG: adenylate/guanylate cyclase domain-containing protein [Chlamydiae bacterium]|nr:adenylate/guanylate cyclase domain-containing protein [Chlamydiota bacterium]MBI3277241.1 adenylate/guanylate cyclase domain-containing protein [Chlamydiota bacterium]